MRLYIFLVVNFLCATVTLNAQENSQKILDSLDKAQLKSYDLFDQSKYGEAIKISTKIIDYINQSKDSVIKNTEGQKIKGYSLRLLGNSFFSIGEDSMSFHYSFKAIDVFKKINDTISLMAAYNDIGVNYRESNSIKKAKHYFNKTYELAKQVNSQVDLVYPLYNIASIDILFEDEYKKGIKKLNEVEKIIKSNKDLENIRIEAETYALLTYAYQKLGDQKNGDLYFKKCENLSNKNGYLELLATLYFDTANTYKANNKYKDAHLLSEKYITLQDSINKIKEYETAKRIEVESFLKQNKEKLIAAEKEKDFQTKNLQETKAYNYIFAALILALIICLYFIYVSYRKLSLSKQKAEQLSETKSNFYSEISHELRTPLYAVIELSRLLLNEKLTKTQREYIESLNFSGNHLLSLVNNVLELNKIESGKLKLESINFHLKTLLINIIESLEYAIRNSGNKIHLIYDDKIPHTLVGDSLKLSQIIINLISNAIKFTSNGNIHVTVKLEYANSNNSKLFFEIKDNGIGISKENQAKIFEDFYQEKHKTEHSCKGTGLGLSIVKRILVMMESEIKIESEPEKGTAFSFFLDFTHANYITKETSGYHKQQEEIKGKKILIVDDNKINQLVTKKTLDQLYIKNKVVDSGKQAIELVKTERFDCILMDLHMPELDGYQTTSIIRNFNKQTPIIALTAASTEEVKAKIDSSEMNDYIMKPFVKDNFINTIHYHIFNDSLNLPKPQTA